MTSGWSGARSRRSGSAGYTEPAGSTFPLLPYGKFIKPRRDGVMGNVDGVRPTTLLLPRPKASACADLPPPPDRQPGGCLRGKNALLSSDKDSVTPVPARMDGRKDEDLISPTLQLPGVGGCGPLGLVESIGIVLGFIDDSPLPYLDPLSFRAPFHTIWLQRTGNSCCAPPPLPDRARPRGRPPIAHKAFLLTVPFQVPIPMTGRINPPVTTESKTRDFPPFSRPSSSGSARHTTGSSCGAC